MAKVTVQYQAGNFKLKIFFIKFVTGAEFISVYGSLINC